MNPEQQAKSNIDRLPQAAGWLVCEAASTSIHAARGAAIRGFPLPGHGFADYLLYVDGKAAGVIEALVSGQPWRAGEAFALFVGLPPPPRAIGRAITMR